MKKKIKLKKTFLLYLRSYQELRILYLSDYLSFIENEYQVSILVDENLPNLNLDKFIDYHNIKKLKVSKPIIFFLKLKSFFKQFFLLLCFSSLSESCRQIFIKRLLFLPYFLLKIPPIRNKIYFKLIENRIIYLTIKITSKVINNIFDNKIKIFYKSRSKKNKPNRNSFDFIFCGSAYAYNNNLVINKYSSSKTKVYSLFRNIDTIPCKGFLSRKFDCVFYVYKSTKSYLKKYKHINHPKSYYLLDIFQEKLNSHKSKGRNYTICFAGSDEYMNPHDPYVAYLVFKAAINKIQKPFKLQLRLLEGDKINRYEKILKEFNYEVYYVPISSSNKDSIEKDTQNLSKINKLISSTSTIALEAKLFGINSALYNPMKSNKYVYERDHIQDMRRIYKVPIFNNINDLEIFLLHNT